MPLPQVRPNFIAKIEEYNVSCKLGESECAGNEQQLCMYRYASADAFWKFVMCQNADPPSIGQVSSLPENPSTILHGPATSPVLS